VLTVTSHARTWYRIALAGAGPAPAVVVAPGEHLGDAVANGVRHVGRGAWAAAVALADASEVPLGESLGKHEVVERPPIDPAELPIGLRWPLGVVPSFGDAARAAAIAAGYARRPGDVVALEATVGGPELDDVLLGLVEKLPAADNVEIRVMDHHDGAGTTEVWLTPRIDARRAIRLLDDHDIELLHNGHVEVSIYLRAQHSTLRLSEHKTIVWLSEDEALSDKVAGWMRDAGLPEREHAELSTLAQLGHFHWRPAATSPRRRLIDKLKRLGMRLVDSWKAPS
jgi:hypothetical protein